MPRARRLLRCEIDRLAKPRHRLGCSVGPLVTLPHSQIGIAIVRLQVDGDAKGGFGLPEVIASQLEFGPGQVEVSTMRCQLDGRLSMAKCGLELPHLLGHDRQPVPGVRLLRSNLQNVTIKLFGFWQPA